MLRVDGLSVRYGPHSILKDVSFSVKAGQWLMIVGPNGAGKSTLLSAVSGGAPCTGSVLLEGRDIRSLKPGQRARRLGVLMQSHAMSYSFTVEEVVRLGRYAWSKGMLEPGSGHDDEMVEQALAQTGLESQRHQSILTLSGGELQRTFFAQLLAQNPALLLLDEPTSHLDPVYQKQLLDLLQLWLEEPGRAVVSVVHDLSLARAYGTHALLLHQGRAAAFGAVKDVLADQHLQAVYGMDIRRWLRTMLSQWE